jgi:hypothetical protein
MSVKVPHVIDHFGYGSAQNIAAKYAAYCKSAKAKKEDSE